MQKRMERRERKMRFREIFFIHVDVLTALLLYRFAASWKM